MNFVFLKIFNGMRNSTPDTKTAYLQWIARKLEPLHNFFWSWCAFYVAMTQKNSFGRPTD
jgi:hypothetical protein